jgi:hypothetical protein
MKVGKIHTNGHSNMSTEFVSLDRKLYIVTDIAVAFVSCSWQRICVLHPCYIVGKLMKLFRRSTYVNLQY